MPSGHGPGAPTTPARGFYSASAARLAQALLDRLRAPGGRAAQTGSSRSGTRPAPPPDHGLLWCAFAFAGGIWAYFALSDEPSPWPVALLALALAPAVAAAHSHGRLRRPLLLAWWALLGFLAGTLRTALVAAPVLGSERTVEISGFIEAIDRDGGGAQVVLAPVLLSGLAEDALPRRVRVLVRGDGADGLAAGDAVALRARLFPPSGPVRPGGYDFAFRAFYQGIGATGFAFGAVQPVDLGPRPAALEIRRQVALVRDGLGERIRRQLGDGDAGAIAVALLVGLRGGISAEAQDSLRQAGLAHVLAISGLHMALFSGGVYAAVLAVLAVFERVTLRFAIHRWAAALALIAASAYLVLSGASVATQRSYLMIALVFAGILAGRRGLTMRSLALAGLAILAWSPESLFAPGFQMSFAAVLCLIAVYGAWARRPRAAGFERRRAAGAAERMLRRAGLWLTGLVVTSLVAGVATGIVGVYHFERASPYGLIGNLLAMPVVSFVVMPAGVLALALLPFGVAAGPLWIMGRGIEAMLAAARWTQALTPNEGVVGSLPASAACLLIGGLFAMVLAAGRMRLAALAPLGLGLALALAHRPADVHIPDRGVGLAARDGSGTLRVSARRPGFASEGWLRAEAVAPSAFPSRRMTEEQQRCDAAGCVVLAHAPSAPGSDAESARGPRTAPLTIALVRDRRALPTDCVRADVVITQLQAPEGCGGQLVVDAVTRATTGALALWLVAEEGRTRIVRLERGNSQPRRPWRRPMPDSP
ncbi:ComEC/Rec2-related protein [Polymorphum gilvum SL003B-26A1]|uniref:ComEC/Rec2-related protein n=1 Tax=Polymorphum gilvum (strain LMG 25793 / CGMCC 1.9160 / SL003B-26A1) TaxID=991905 RepID=F2IY31_POLGS|nr:ComEC/Rec2-related protein [Polymorphum gilvum SL003B-26A1]